MGLEDLLGNEQLKSNLQNAIRRGRISHFYLISGPAGSGKRTLARLLSAAILCQNGGEKPCFACNTCRKVMADTHPDVITVTDPEHKNIPVKMVRDIREQMFIRPNEAERKIYIFAQDMGDEGHNALLKVLEEPPSYGVFLLLTDNAQKLPITVRSRCTELRLQSLPRNIMEPQLRQQFPDTEEENLQAAMDRCGGYLGQALEILEQGNAVSPQTEQFVAAFSQKSLVGMLQTLAPMEKWNRDRLMAELQQWEQVLHQALSCRCGMTAPSRHARELSQQRSSSDLLQAQRDVKKAIAYIQGNVSTAAVCGHLVWALGK